MKKYLLILTLLLLAIPAFADYDNDGVLTSDSIRADIIKSDSIFTLRAMSFDSVKVVTGTLVWYSGGVGYSGAGATPYDSAFVAANAHLLQGKDTIWIKSLTGSGGSTNADSLNHILVTAPAPANGDFLKYVVNKWVNSSQNVAGDTIEAREVLLYRGANPNWKWDIGAMGETVWHYDPVVDHDGRTLFNGNLWENADTAKVAKKLLYGSSYYTADFPVSLMAESLATKAPLSKPSFLDSLFMATSKPVMHGAVPVKDTLTDWLRIKYAMLDTAKADVFLGRTPETGQVGMSGNALNSAYADTGVFGSTTLNPATASYDMVLSSGSTYNFNSAAGAINWWALANSIWQINGAGVDFWLSGVGASATADTLKANNGLALRTTMLDSIWVANDSLNIYTGGIKYGYPRVATAGSYTDEQAQDAVGAMSTGSLAYVDATPSFQLSGDATSPGNSKLYGTNSSGTKGWYDQPSGSGVPATTVTSETSYGIASAVGTATSYAREDHTHGSPATTKDKTAITGILKGNGTDVSAATAGTDYLTTTLGTAVNSKNADSLNHKYPDFGVDLLTDSLAVKLPLHALADSANVSKLAWSADSVDHVHPDFPVNLITDSLAVKLPLHALADSSNLAKSATNAKNADSLNHYFPDFNVSLMTDSLAVKLPIAGKAADATVADSSRGGAVRLAGYTPDFPVSLMTDSLAVKIPTAQKAAASGVASLDGSSLVVQNPANATATPTASKIPIADVSGKLAAGWGGNASTLATLNATSLVVENPANATATATATKIPISDGSGKLDTWISNASETVVGKVELATSTEINTGTDATRAISPDALAGSIHGQTVLEIYLFEGATAVTTGDGKGYIYIAPKLNGMNIVSVCASLIGAASSSGTPTIQVARGRQASATTIYSYSDVLSTRITIDASEWSCKDATTAPVINTANDDLLTGDMLRFDVDVAGTGATGLIVEVTCQLP